MNAHSEELRSQILSRLKSLAQLDVDAVHAYKAAIKRIDIPSVKQKLTEFCEDHEKHIVALSPFIQEFGGEIPSHTPDLKGFFIQGMTAIRSMVSNESALNAMKSNEELTNKTYQEALEVEFPPHVKAVVKQNYNDEKKHLHYIQECLRSKVWEHSKAA